LPTAPWQAYSRSVQGGCLPRGGWQGDSIPIKTKNSPIKIACDFLKFYFLNRGEATAKIHKTVTNIIHKKRRKNMKYNYSKISKVTGISEATLRKRVQKLKDKGESINYENLTAERKIGRPQVEIEV